MFEDILSGLMLYRYWGMLAWMEIKNRYNRSILGPFWITVSTAFTIIIMGPLYSHIFRSSLDDYIENLVIGLVSWNYISTTINEGALCLIGAENYLKFQNIPKSVFVFKVLTRNLIVFLHNLVLIFIILIYFDPSKLENLILLPLGMLLLSVNLFWICFLTAIISARFRDAPQMISNLLQALFFITPIVWLPQQSSNKINYYLLFNPLNYMLGLIREPIISHAIFLSKISVSLVSLIIGFFFLSLLYKKYSNRINYWL